MLKTVAKYDESSVDITGGTIDGTSIGASSASSGAFTTLSAASLTVSSNTGNVTIEDSNSSQNTAIARVMYNYNSGTLGFVGYDGASSGALEIWNTYNGSVIIGTNNTERLRVKSTGQLRFVPLAADPAGAEAGDVYYNSGTNKLRLYDGSSWVDLN